MSKVGLVIAGTLATGAIGAGAIIGYQQLSNNSNSNVAVQQADTTTANTNQANSNTEAAKSSETELLGAWVSTNDANGKVVFTEDELIVFQNDQELKSKYKRLNDQEIEVISQATGKTIKYKATISDGELTLEFNGKTDKFKRESGDMTERIKEIETKIKGTWTIAVKSTERVVETPGGGNSDERPKYKNVEKWTKAKDIIFGDNLVQVLIPNGGSGSYLGWIGPYRIKDEKTVEVQIGWANAVGGKATYNLRFGNEGELIIDYPDNGARIFRSSNKSEFVDLKVWGNGTAGSDNTSGIWVSDNDKLLLDYGNFCSIKSDGTVKSQRYSYPNGNNLYTTDSGDTFTADLTTLTVNYKNGSEQKYTRLTNWNGENYIPLCSGKE